MEREQYLNIIKQHLKTAYLLSDEKATTMIPVFLNTLETHFDRLNELAANGDTAQLSRASHAVKGALLNMGLTDFAELAYTLEKRCHDEKSGIDSCRELINQLHAFLSVLAGDK